jgi:hypothetical protein
MRSFMDILRGSRSGISATKLGAEPRVDLSGPGRVERYHVIAAIMILNRAML